MEEYTALDFANALEKRAKQEQNKDFAFELKSSALVIREFASCPEFPPITFKGEKKRDTSMKPLTEKDMARLKEKAARGEIHQCTEKESCMFVLRALVNYHERVTMGDHPELDMYANGLRYALKCVEAYQEEEGTAQSDTYSTILNR